MRVEEQTNGAETAGFKAPRRFSHTGTEMTGTIAVPFGALSYLNENPGAPEDKPSYHRSEYDGNFGVQLRDVARTDQGWRTYEEQR